MRRDQGSVLIEFALFVLVAGWTVYFSWSWVVTPQRQKLHQIFNERLKYDGEKQWKD